MLAAVILYCVVMFAYVAIQPSVSYDDKGNLKPFGFGDSNKTIFPLWIVGILVAVIIGFLYSLFGGLAETRIEQQVGSNLFKYK